MAKKALLDVLEQTIGKYVRNLDAESLNVAVWSGKIALNNLELDVGAVNSELDRQAADAPNLAMPFEVLSGHFSAFEVDVPWAYLTSRSVVLRAHGLHIKVRPYDRLAKTDYFNASVDNEEERAIHIREVRQKSIQQYEKYRLQEYAVRKLASETNNANPSLTQQGSTFSSRLARRIMENIQIEIKDVHVSLADSEGSAGIVLESLSLVTTDKDGQRVFVDRTTGSITSENSFLHKMLLMEGLGVYLDHEDATDLFMSPRASLTAIQETNSPSTVPAMTHSYILAPLSFQAKLRQADGSVCVDFAKYQLSSELSSLSILLSRQQLDLARKISKEVSSSGSAVVVPLFPEYRPETRVTSGRSAKEWWKYAVRCIGRLNGRRSWVEFFRAFEKRKRYIPLYKRQAHHETCSWIEPLSASEHFQLVTLEQDRTISVEGLMAWRNMADSQVDMEKLKHYAKQKNKKTEGSTSYFSSIFGSTKNTAISDSGEDHVAENEPPIQLTTQELKELEAMSRQDFAEPELSQDSKLCDVQFVLNALKINLTSHDMRHLAELEMGIVKCDFIASADGAFGFNFDLADLEIHDRATPNSLFPSVLKSSETDITDKRSTAFHLHLSKTKTGDQTLIFNLAAFEAVASQILMRELNHFLSDTSKTPVTSGKTANPLLAQSISGSVDLFYDADQGQSTQLPTAMPQSEDFAIITPRATQIVPRPPNTAPIGNDLSIVLIDAWKEKMVTKATWSVNVDIKAPVLIIPERCNDPRADILVFDLGNLKLTYGQIKSSDRVSNWFKNHPRTDGSEVSLDSGSVVVSDLTFKVGRASDWRLIASGASASDTESSVIEPIAVSLDFGVESPTSAAENPRVCVIGVVPTISLRISPSQGSNIIHVIDSWSSLLSDFNSKTPDSETLSKQNDGEVISSEELEPSRSVSAGEDDQDVELAEAASNESYIQPQLYFLIGLQRLSITVSLDPRNTLEAHLISVYASSETMVDGSSIVGLRMGWFWVLDLLEASYVRRQRLLAHSNLPGTPEQFASVGNYNMLEELKRRGVFDKNFAGSTELADISLTTISPTARNAAELCGEKYIRSILDASFSSLFVHWNPRAIKEVNGMIEKFSTVLEGYDDASTVILSADRSPRIRGVDNTSNEKPFSKFLEQTLIKARMQSVELNLNSARDDYPVFIFSVSGTEAKILSSQNCLETSIKLGDVRVRTPENMGKTLLQYRTLLGLAPGRNESLLTVKYYQGKESIYRANCTELLSEELEAYAEVELSPMRLNFIQSQVMALVEYFSEGILGALTATAAQSAAQAAIDMADAVVGKKLFKIRATSLDLILPQAAYIDKVISIHAGFLDVDYIMFPGMGGSKAKVALADVSLHGPNGRMMQDDPVKMTVGVVLPSDGFGSLDDQAMRVHIQMSRASFLLSQSQYAQILQTLDENTGEIELFLRDSNTQIMDDESEHEDFHERKPLPQQFMTHAGNQFVEKQRRMFLNVSAEVLALQLCSSSFEPIIRIAAVDASISYGSHPDQERSKSEVFLRNVVCEDVRPKASGRQYRFLIQENDEMDTEIENLFYVGYSSGKNDSTLELKVGSPQFVIIPDAIAEVVSFFQSDGDHDRDSRGAGKIIRQEEKPALGQNLIQLSESNDGVETSLIESPVSSQIGITTKTCRIVLVDLGSQLSHSSMQTEQLTETLVLQGIFSANMSSKMDAKTNKRIESEFSLQADSMEVFSAFGSEMKSPLQILEPSSGSALGTMKTAEDGASDIEVRAAALTVFDFTFSMHNAALLSAIANSLRVSFADTEDTLDGLGETNSSVLTENETKHLESLASALENSEQVPLTHLESSRSLTDSITATGSEEMIKEPTGSKIQIKITMPETRITVINDLQGLDEALFRVSVINFVAGLAMGMISDPRATFDFHLNTSILADYFDTSCNMWNKLLTQPWEVNLKAIRGPSRRFRSERLSTSIDLESFPCCISFSEQFLVSVASASRMWSTYSVATAVQTHVREAKSLRASTTAKASMAASAARNLVISLPYAIENHCGINVEFSLPGSEEENSCPNGTIQYFRFEPPRGRGFGGKRAYGQDVEFEKSVSIAIPDGTILRIGHLDHEFGLPKRTHRLQDGRTILTYVVKEGKTTVLHLTSHVTVRNNTAVPFRVSARFGGSLQAIGTCPAHNLKRGRDTPLFTSTKGVASKESRIFSIPIDLLELYQQKWNDENVAQLNISVSPCMGDDDSVLSGYIHIEASHRELTKSNDGQMISKFDVVCSPQRNTGRLASSLVVQVILKMYLTPDKEVCADVCLEPRALIENRIPITIKLRTPMPYTFSSSPHEEILGQDTIYILPTGGRVEVFTPGPSIAVTMTTANTPIAGCDSDWLEGGWIDLPLLSDFRLVEPVPCQLPFNSVLKTSLGETSLRGNEFFIAEGVQSLADLALPQDEIKKKRKGSSAAEPTMAASGPDTPLRTFFVTVCYYGVDHTGNILFEQSPPPERKRMSGLNTSIRMKRPKSQESITSPRVAGFGAYASTSGQRRISLLSGGNLPLRILQMTMDDEAGFRGSLPFYADEVPIGDAGVGAIPIFWGDRRPSGYYAYRSIANEHQTEIHIIPEYIVFNGGKHIVVAKERGRPEVIIESGKFSQLGVDTRQEGLELALFFIELDCKTSYVRVDSLGMKVAILRSSNGFAVGSVCIQTVIDTHGHARLTVKVGDINKGSAITTRRSTLFSDDFFRFRVRWTELQLILNELHTPDFKSWSVARALSTWTTSPRSALANTSVSTPTKETASDLQESRPGIFGKRTPSKETENGNAGSEVEILQQPVASIIFSRFTFDFQRVFKDQQKNAAGDSAISPERSQISLIVHHVVIKDLTPESKFPMVFDCSATNSSFLDLCIRLRGPTNAELVSVDLFDLNLAHLDGKCARIELTTSEDFVWKILDLAHRILAASGEFAGYALKLEEDDIHGGFIVKIEDTSQQGVQSELAYTPPKTDTLYDISVARVSPFSLLVTFKRNPQIARYKKVNPKVRGSALMNYFSRRLKFTIDRAELNFAAYEDRSLKGPPDRLFEKLFAVYMSRMRFKLVTLLTSASLQDWKFLAARDDGGDEYVEGDLLRATGNLTGKASHLLFKRAGQKLGEGVSDLSRAVGDTIESTTDKMGVGRVGKGVNSVVSGVGDGVGSAVSGVGSGTGKILKGVGQGIGQAFGGVSGGAMQIGKGIGKGIKKGDGKAVIEGLSQGVSSVGGGLAQGAESAVVGAADGVLSAGRGLFSGVKSVGKGIGGAFTGKKPKKKVNR